MSEADEKWQVVRLRRTGEDLVRDGLSRTDAEALFESLSEKSLRSEFRVEQMRPLREPTFESLIKIKAADEGLAPSLISAPLLQDLDIATLDKAVIFYHGIWSGPSAVTFNLLLAGLAKSERPLPLIVVNADDVTGANKELHELAQKIFGSIIGAWGETSWIAKGQIIAQDVLYWKKASDSTYIPVTGNSHRRVGASAEEILELVRNRIEQIYAKCG